MEGTSEKLRDAQTALMAFYRQLRAQGCSHNTAAFQTRLAGDSLDPEVAQQSLAWFASWARFRGPTARLLRGETNSVVGKG